MELARAIDLALACGAAGMVLVVILRTMRPVPPCVGDPAPDLTLADHDGLPVTLSHLAGRWVVLAFYPKAETPG